MLEILSTVSGNLMAALMRDMLTVLLQLLANGNSVSARKEEGGLYWEEGRNVKPFTFGVFFGRGLVEKADTFYHWREHVCLKTGIDVFGKDIGNGKLFFFGHEMWERNFCFRLVGLDVSDEV